MADQDGWSSGLQWVIWAVLMSLVMAWLARMRNKPRPPRQTNLLVHPPSTLIVGIVCIGLFVALAVLAALLPGETDSPLISLLFLGFAALGVPIVCDYRFARHTLTADGMQYGRMFGGGGVLRWRDVHRVRYSTSSKWFRLESVRGDVVRVSAMLLGLPEFARAVLANVPSESIDPQTRPVLEETAEGRLPPIWR